MIYGVIYRLQWNTVVSVISATVTIPAQVMIVNIYDTETLIPDDHTPEIIILKAAANPLVIKVINNDETNKLSPIRAKQATIQFISDINQNQDVTTFSDSADNRWYVEITADGNDLFKGFLMLADSQMDFLPDPNTVVLTASDHLALLKDIPLTTDEGANPSGKYKIGELIAMCLKKTGLTLGIIVVNNLRSGGGQLVGVTATFSTVFGNGITFTGNSDFFYIGQRFTISGTASNNGTFTVTAINFPLGLTFISVRETVVTEDTTATVTDELSSLHIYDGVYLDAKTFEKEIGISEFCYSVLEKILGEDCFLTQWKGLWYIMRVDEYDGNPIYPATFNSDGIFQSFDSPTSFSKSIGANETRRLANADALLRFDRPNKFIQENFRFEYPAETLCNSNLSRGTLNATLSTDEYDAYDPECWVFESVIASVIGPGPSTGGFIKVVNVDGIETERYLQIVQTVSNTFLYFRSTDKIPIQISDKFKLSVDWKYDTNVGGAGHYHLPVAQLRLYGDDGSHWFLNAIAGYNSIDPRTYWIQSDATWATNNRFLYQDGEFDQDDLSNWTTAELTAAPAPVTGRLEIYLMHNFSSDDRGKSFAAISFEYIPYLRGTYSILTGDYDKVSRASNSFLAKRERDVFIQDCLKELFKGAMFFKSGAVEIFTGSVTFSAPNAINISGYSLYNYYPGQIIRVSGSVSNDGDYIVTAVNYVLIGPFTQIVLREQTIVNETVSATLSEIIFNLTKIWYSAAPLALGYPPDTTYLHPYGYLQAFSIWNQYVNANRIFSTSVLGLGSMWCDALDKISLMDANQNTNNRYFMLISFEQNWKTALWSGVFIEDYRTDIPKHTEADDDYEFNYTTK